MLTLGVAWQHLLPGAHPGQISDNSVFVRIHPALSPTLNNQGAINVKHWVRQVVIGRYHMLLWEKLIQYYKLLSGTCYIVLWSSEQCSMV